MTPERSLARTPFRLGDWDIHPEDGTLRSPAEVRRLEPQHMDLLAFLSTRAGAVVSKQQLVDEVWGGRIVSDDALTGAVSQVRKALGDNARNPRYLETIHKRGYRLLALPAALGDVGRGEAALPPGVAGSPGGPASHRRTWRRIGLAAGAAAAVAAVLLLAFARRQPGGTATDRGSPALEAYRKGRALLEDPSETGLQQARLHFTKALEMDPGLGKAAAGLAEVSILEAFGGVGNPSELFPRARAAALRAAELDPESAEARAALAAVYLFADHDFARAEQESRRAIALRPGFAGAHRIYAHLLAALGRDDEAVAEARRAVELAPFDLSLRTSLAEVLFTARRFDAAVRHGEETLALAPDFAPARFQLGWAYAFMGRDTEAYASFRLGCRAASVPEENLARLDAVFAAEGLPGVYRSVVRGLEQIQAVRGGNWGDLLAFYAAAGDADRAFALVEHAFERGEPTLVWLRASPFSDGLRSDPRFEPLVRRLGLPPAPPG